MEDFRLISLIGSLYKIIVKTLALRLSKVMDPIILEIQSTFISGRQISDDITTVNEIVDEAKKNR